MIALVQRVQHASVRVGGEVVGEIGKGMLVLLGVHKNDTEQEMVWVCNKVSNLRIFPDENNRMNASLIDIQGEALVVSQFTLYGAVRKGNRPSFEQAASPEAATKLYEAFVERLQHTLGKPVPTGVFGAMMDVELINEGPVTFIVEKKNE